MPGPTAWHLLWFLADGVGAERRPGGHAHHAGGTGQGTSDTYFIHPDTDAHEAQTSNRSHETWQQRSGYITFAITETKAKIDPLAVFPNRSGFRADTRSAEALFGTAKRSHFPTTRTYDCDLAGSCSSLWKEMWKYVYMKGGKQQPQSAGLYWLVRRLFQVKCHQYWPNVSAMGTYGNFQVSCVSEDGKAAYLLRALTLTHLEVRQYDSITV